MEDGKGTEKGGEELENQLGKLSSLITDLGPSYSQVELGAWSNDDPLFGLSRQGQGFNPRSD